MKKLMLVASILFVMVSASASYAQEKMKKLMEETTPEERAQVQTGMMKENLALTEEQTPQVSSINLKYAQKMQDVYNSGGARMQKLKKMKAVNQEKDGELKKVMTSEQYEKYQKNKEEMKEKVKERAKEKRKEGSK